jgi:hypothetical protein
MAPQAIEIAQNGLADSARRTRKMMHDQNPGSNTWSHV